MQLPQACRSIGLARCSGSLPPRQVFSVQRLSSKALRLALGIIVLTIFRSHPWLSPVIAQSDNGILTLTQSELDYLRAANVGVSLRVNSVRPAFALKALARIGGFRLEIQGRLPNAPTASFDWEASTVKVALAEFAQRYPVEYSVLRPDLLLVIVSDYASEDGGSRQ